MPGETFSLSVLFKVINRATAPMRKIVRQFNVMGVAAKKLGGHMLSLGQQMLIVGRVLAFAITLPIILLGRLAVKSAVDFQKSFTGIRKTVDATVEQFKQLKNELIDMSTKIPVTTEELFTIGEAAGQMGVKIGELKEFTRVIADLGVSTKDLRGEEAAFFLSRFANITGMNRKEFHNLASVIVKLGNDYATSEGQIAKMGLMLAAQGRRAGLAAEEILGMASSLTSLGIRAERGGSAFSRVMQFMTTAVLRKGGEELALFSRTAGKSVQEFSKVYKENPIKAIIAFIDGLTAMESRGKDTSLLLQRLGFGGIRLTDVLGRVTSATANFSDHIATVSKEMVENKALIIESNKYYETMWGRFVLVGNELNLLARSFGLVLAPTILTVLKTAIVPLIRWMREWHTATKIVSIGFLGFVAILGPLIILLAVMIKSVGIILLASVELTWVFTKVKIAVLAVWAVFSTYLGTIALVVVAIVAVSWAVYQLVKNWDALKDTLAGKAIIAVIGALSALLIGAFIGMFPLIAAVTFAFVSLANVARLVIKEWGPVKIFFEDFLATIKEFADIGPLKTLLKLYKDAKFLLSPTWVSGAEDKGKTVEGAKALGRQQLRGLSASGVFIPEQDIRKVISSIIKRPAPAYPTKQEPSNIEVLVKVQSNAHAEVTVGAVKKSSNVGFRVQELGDMLTAGDVP